ncbi:hypothetical protein ATCV1_z342R [Acanthocystis turfacea chlorella virus 1]|uniref:Uncharacterized protein z342R n=1 Tax=Chlorovirus heliozoae TaxID=322019 RepID=A7K8V2_9PHYC|nr:hypothetical protein ATCV1_z342R [Acanthocystis turfacea chlorella virus 1]ABT16476.1 hypothetical protein ATCV1_z342R [Acanthocystis turfacea chlorella virus 1]
MSVVESTPGRGMASASSNISMNSMMTADIDTASVLIFTRTPSRARRVTMLVILGYSLLRPYKEILSI